MKILIRFKGDNDFGHVLFAFGNLLLQRVSFYGSGLDNETVARWFNELAPTVYEMLSTHNAPARLASTRKYLQIGPDDVFVGAAADKKMETWHSWGNNDSVMVDDSEHVQEKVYLV
jgi:hypothetical protein